MKKDELLSTLRLYEEESKKAYKLRHLQGDKTLAQWHEGFHTAIKEAIDLVEQLETDDTC